MKRWIAACFTVAVFTLSAAGQTKNATAPKKTSAAPKKLELKDLPPAVQKTVQDEGKVAEIRNISRETEDGISQYEIETMLNGKHRDFNVDTKGVLLVVEDETSIDSIPAPARATIMKKVGPGKLGMVETVTKPKQKDLLYEAEYTTKDGKKHEVVVKADGTETKD
jgi:hypothetical protein